MRTVKLTAVDASGEVFEMSETYYEHHGFEYLAYKYQSYCGYRMRKAGFVPVSITVEVF